MKRILVVGEDALCCALGERLVGSGLPDWQLAQTSIDTRGVTKLKAALPRYLTQARHVQPVLCIADTDGQCPKQLLADWLSHPVHPSLLLRLAVTEAESWLLADRAGLATAFGIPVNKLPHSPDEVPDPKRLILHLAQRSKRRHIRDEVVSRTDSSRPGSGYNLHLATFVRQQWNIDNAIAHSPSLARAFKRLAGLTVPTVSNPSHAPAAG